MTPIADQAAAFLEQHPHPALRLSELLEPVAERIDHTLSLDRLRQALAEYPEVFRLLDPWRGPWRPTVRAPAEVPRRAAGGPPAATHGPGAAWDPLGEVWVVLLRDPGEAPAHRTEPHQALRESVRWLARYVDPRSGLSVSRWYAIALAERESRRALARRAAA